MHSLITEKASADKNDLPLKRACTIWSLSSQTVIKSGNNLSNRDWYA